MKKALLVTLDFYPSVGGIATYWRRLSEYFSSDAWVVLAPPLPPDTSEPEVPYPLYRRSFLSPYIRPRWLALIANCIRVIVREKPSVIIAAQVLPVGTACLIVSVLTRVPYIVSLHGMDVGTAWRHARKRFLCRIVLKYARRIVVNSEYTARLVEYFGISRDHITVVYPCPSITEEEGKMNIERHAWSRPTLLTVGRLVARKGHDAVIQALPRIKEKFPDICYVIVGNGPERDRLEKRVESLSLGDAVLFVDTATDAMAAWWYAHCTLFIMTPREIDGDVEGFGIVYLEANSFGKPVIATASGGVTEAVEEGVSGSILPSADPDLIADEVLRLLGNPEYASSLGHQGKIRAQKHFSWNTQACTLKDVIESL